MMMRGRTKTDGAFHPGRWATLVILSMALVGQAGDACAKALPDRAVIEKLTGVAGAVDSAAGVVKVSLPRTDVPITVDSVAIPPYMGLISWAAFWNEDSAKAMVMGDLVLFPDEVNPVISTCIKDGLEVTALHNHFFYDNPKVFYMHIGGDSTLEILAKGVGDALRTVRDIRSRQPIPQQTFGTHFAMKTNSITADPIETILGVNGQSKDGMLKVVIGRKATMPCGCEVGAAMGLNTWAAFGGTDAQSLVDGDFAMQDAEVQPVIKALRDGGINIVAIHSHMTGETPHYTFLHFWGTGSAVNLAHAIRSALDKQSGALSAK